MEILVPSANDVTIRGFWWCFSAKPLCVSGVRYGSWSPLMLPASIGRNPMLRTNRYRFMITARLVPIRVREDDPCAIGVNLEERPDGRIELRIHEHEVLAPGDRRQCHMGAELDLARGLDDDVHSRGVGQSGRIFSDRITTGGDRLIQLRSRAHVAARVGAGFAYARFASASVRFAMATSRMPRVARSIWNAMPRPMYPAPTRATRTGLFSAPSARARCQR